VPLREEWPEARFAWRVVALLTFVYGIAFVHRIGMSLLVGPLQADLHFSDTQIGLLTGVLFAVPYTLGGPLFGWLADRRSRSGIVRAASLAWCAATAACGLVTSFLALAGARFFLGITQSALQPAAASMIADCFRADVRPRAYGLFVTGTAWGTAAAYWLGALAVGVGHLLSQSYGIRDWSGAFLALGAFGLLAPLAMLFAREPQRRERSAFRSFGVKVTLRFVRREALVVGTLCLGIALVFLAPYGQLAFMPVMFERRYGWSPAELATAYGAVAIIAGSLGSLGAGWLSAWIAGRGRANGDWTVCLIGAVGSLLPGIAAPLMPTGALSLVMFGLAGVFTNWPAVGALGAIARLGPNEMRGQLTALYTSTVGLVGAGLGPLLVGVLSDHLRGGVAAALSITFALCAVSSVALLAAGSRAYARAVTTATAPPDPVA
jgi:MFS family permease